MHAVMAAIAATAALAGGNACAMSTGESKPANCRVIGGEKLPPESGGAGAICRAIKAAVSQRAPGLAYEVEVTVVQNSRLSASIMVGGRKLADQNFARMDRPLTKEAFDRFAMTVAEELAKAGTGES